MFRKCSVPKCNSLRQDVKLHQLPANQENKSRWLNCIGYDVTEIGTNIHVCHKHFEKRFVNPKTNRLKCDAYPSLFTDLEISSGNPSTVLQEADSKKTCSDHTYSKKHYIEHSYAQPHKLACLEVNVPCGLISVEHAAASSSMAMQDIQGPCHLTSMEYAVVSSSTALHDAQSLQGPKIQDTQGSSCKTPRKPIKRRLIRNKKSLTPRCQLLYKEYKKAKRQNDYKSRAKKALAFSKEKSLEELTKNMNPLTKKVLWMQVKLCTKDKKARRFTREEKLIALSIYKQGPKSYRFLQKIFILPSKSTLKKMISQLNIDTGINQKIFDHIKQQVTKWEERKKLCTVIYDEMAIETALTYAAHKDNIVGFVDLNGKVKSVCRSCPCIHATGGCF